MPLQFCPISFTLFPLIKRGGKTYSFLMHIRANSDTSSGVIDHIQSPLPSTVPMSSIIRPHSFWFMLSRQHCCHQFPTTTLQASHPQHHQPPPSSSHCFTIPLPVLSFSFYSVTFSSPILGSCLPDSLLPRPPLLPCPPFLFRLYFCSLFIPSCNQIMATSCWC